MLAGPRGSFDGFGSQFMTQIGKHVEKHLLKGSIADLPIKVNAELLSSD